MNTMLTDILACPVCDTESMLVLLAEQVADRKVLEGVLGCPQCRRQYPVTEGRADLNPDPGGVPMGADATSAEPDEQAVVRLAALLGLAQPGGVVLLAGDAAAFAAELAALVEVEVVAVGEAAPGGAQPRRVSRIRTGARLPFLAASLRAVALGGETALDLLEDAARVLAPGGRLVVESAADAAVSRVEAAGLRVLVHEAGILVAER